MTLKWVEEIGFEFVRSLPRSKPFRPFSENERLFQPEEPGNFIERFLVEFPQAFTGSREGGFFIILARRPPDRPAA